MDLPALQLPVSSPNMVHASHEIDATEDYRYTEFYNGREVPTRRDRGVGGKLLLLDTWLSLISLAVTSTRHLWRRIYGFEKRCTSTKLLPYIACCNSNPDTILLCFHDVMIRNTEQRYRCKL